MSTRLYRLQGKVWLYPGNAAWHFISIEKTPAANIRVAHGKRARGFGSLPVEVTLGKTTWKTSIFPDSKSGTYLLPLKMSVRKKENVFRDDTVEFTLKMRQP